MAERLRWIFRSKRYEPPTIGYAPRPRAHPTHLLCVYVRMHTFTE